MLLPPERLISVTDFGDSTRHENTIARTHGIRFTVRKMGNGVIRIEDALLDPIGFMERDAARHDRYRMERFPRWMLDAVNESMLAVGSIPATEIERMASVAYVIPANDRVLQFFGWRHPSFFGGGSGNRTHGPG